MKKVSFLCLIVLGVFFSACHSDDDTWGDWAKSNAFPGDNRVSAVAFQKGDVAYVGLGFNNNLSTSEKFLRSFYKFDGTNWTSISELFPTLGRKGCVAFVIGDTAYIGAGFRDRSNPTDSKEHYYSDFYKFDVKNDKWYRDADGKPLITDIGNYVSGDDSVACRFWGGIGFEMNGKGYVGTGQLDGRVSKSMFEYDPSTGAWRSMPTPPFDARVGGVVFKLQNKAIVALGSNGDGAVVDVYAFDGTNWEWKRPLRDLDGSWNDDYGQIPRSFAVAFTSDLDGEKGYVAGGQGMTTAWEYRLEEDRWYEVTQFPSAMTPRVAGVGFSIKGYGYVTTGGSALLTANNNTTWRFIPGIDEDDNNDY